MNLKLPFLLGFMILALHSIAQILPFNTVPAPSNIPDQYFAFDAYDHELIDVDADGDLDLLSFKGNLFCHKNDGRGDFSFYSSQSLPLPSGEGSRIETFDLENDGDLDVLVFKPASGFSILVNDGNGNFNLQFSESGITAEIILGDINNDSLTDILTSKLFSNTSKLHLLLNNGNGSFIADSIRGVNAINKSALGVGDLNLDGYSDIFLRIPSGSSSHEAKIFFGNNLAQFTPDTLASFWQFDRAKVYFFDKDGDLDLDLILDMEFDASCCNNTPKCIDTKYYENDGSGNFTLLSDWFDPAQKEKLSIIDLDNDGDLDVVFQAARGCKFWDDEYFYVNQSNGTFQTVSGQITSGIPTYTAGAFGDINGDSLVDYFSEYGFFIQQDTLRFVRATGGAVSYLDGDPFYCLLDFDGDDWIDIYQQGFALFGGIYPVGGLYTSFHYNQANLPLGFDYPDRLSGWQGNIGGRCIIRDFNGDGQDDFLSVGKIHDFGVVPIDILLVDSNKITRVPSQSSSIAPTTFGESRSSWGHDIHVADFDCDGDYDVYKSSDQDNNSNFKPRIFYNNGDATFISELVNNEFIFYERHDFSDIDKDGDLDLFQYGVSYKNNVYDKNPIQLYENIGSENFKRIPFDSSEIMIGGRMRFIDLNGDDYEDILIYASSKTDIPAVDDFRFVYYLNDKNKAFYRDSLTNIAFLDDMKLFFEDIDNDLKPEIISSGKDQNGNCITNIYTFDGNNKYHLIQDSILPNICITGLGMRDLDRDGRKDAVVNGLFRQNNQWVPYAEVMGNQSLIPTYSIQKQIVCDSYLWHEDNQVYDSTGLYYIKKTNFLGLDSIVYLDLIVKKTSPKLQLIDDSLFVVNGLLYDSVQWVSCAGGQLITTTYDDHFVDSIGFKGYQAISYINHCADTSECFKLVQPPKTFDQSIVIAPNPSNSIIRIYSSKVVTKPELELIDTQGKVKLSIANYKNGQAIDVSQLKSGLYFISFNDSKSKFIISR